MKLRCQISKIFTTPFGFMFLLALLTSNSAMASYQDHDEAKAFIKMMIKEHKFDEKALTSLFASAEKKDSILTAIARPAEKRLEWDEYQDIFLTEKRITQGKTFLKENAAVLTRAAETYGVPAEIISAIIGVETFYGTRQGSYRIIDALSTLGFDYPPRAAFFRKELEQYLLLAKEQGFEAGDLKGSYAGAMGYGQFIPSSYRHYAVDFDHDKVADLFSNVEDAIGSVANYFAEHKWRKGEPVAYPAHLKGNAWASLVASSLKPKHTFADLKAVGVSVDKTIHADAEARLQKLIGKKGEEYWVTLHNFYVITRYNHSHLYAMAVLQLSQKIAEP